MKTFLTEKNNIPEGATHYRDETSRDSFAWFMDGVMELIVNGNSISGMDLAISSENLNNLKPIPQTNIETPEEKEVLDSINSNLIKPREPSKPVITRVEWGGAGLPAVGIECEAVFIEHEHKGYGKFLILGYHGDYVWMEYIGEISNKSKHYTAKVDMVKFRKSETEAERVEREREDAIDEMSLIVESGNGFAGNAYKKYCASLYDAGYRKES